MMISGNILRCFVVLVVLVVLNGNILGTDAASCSVIFHWREKTGGKNWSTQDKEIKGNRSKLSLFIKPDTTFGFTLMGECCWEVYPENSYKGEPVELKSKLPNGFGGIPGHPGFKANSLKKKSPKPCVKST